MKVYIVIRLIENKHPKILGVYSTKALAETVAYSNPNIWCNIVEYKVDKDYTEF